jgi:hypothetical protein
VSSLYSVTVCLTRAVDPEAIELAELEARLNGLGAISSDAMLDQRTGTVEVRFNLAGDSAEIEDRIEAILVTLASGDGWTVAGIAYYLDGEQENETRPRGRRGQTLVLAALVALLAWLCLFVGVGPDDLDDDATEPTVMVFLFVLPMIAILYTLFRSGRAARAHDG